MILHDNFPITYAINQLDKEFKNNVIKSALTKSSIYQII